MVGVLGIPGTLCGLQAPFQVAEVGLGEAGPGTRDYERKVWVETRERSWRPPKSNTSIKWLLSGHKNATANSEAIETRLLAARIDYQQWFAEVCRKVVGSRLLCEQLGTKKPCCVCWVLKFKTSLSALFCSTKFVSSPDVGKQRSIHRTRNQKIEI